MRPWFVRALCVLALSLTAAAVALFPPQVQARQPASCASARHREFDFWIGAWDVRTPNDQVAGRNVIQRILGGCALLENWTGAAGGAGTSLNFWDAGDGRWHQIWIDGQGQPLRLAGALRDGAMVLEGTTPDSAGRVLHQRVTWTPLPDGRVRQHWERSRDRGSWQTVFDGYYSLDGWSASTPSLRPPDPRPEPAR